MTTNPLLDLPSAALALLAGEARQRLVRYLMRWHHSEALLRYLDIWLAEQPASVTLRENRVRALVELGRGDEALAILDAIDAERAPTASRRQFRLRALIAVCRFNEALAALDRDTAAEYDLYAWLIRGYIYRAQEQMDEAATAYREAAAIDPASVAPVRRLAALALAQGDAEGARGQIDALMLRPDFLPTSEDLELLRDAARQMGDTAAETALHAQLAGREQEERDRIAAELGLRLAKHGAEDEKLVEPPPAVERQLPAEAYTVLREQFGFTDFRPNQTRVLASVLAGRRTLAAMPTGAGKSLTYQLPALLLPNATVVVSPLIALMKDQIDSLPASVREQTTMINSTLSSAEVATRLRGITAGQYKLVYIAPERLRQRPFLHALKRCGVSLFVVDEAHCISLWGLSFRPDYLFIKQALEDLGQPPLLALTATASSETQAEIQEFLGATELVSASVFRPNLMLQVVRAGNRDEKQQALLELCRRITGPTIVYARARQTCEELAGLLCHSGIKADYYHAQVADRHAAQERFMHGQTRVLVATVAFGMGIDKADIRAIIHYNLPQSVEAYYQEAGRAGRDGQLARCVLLYAASDKSRMTSWLNEEAITRDQLRELYREAKRAMRGAYDIVSLEQIQRALRSDDETFIRVGLSMLERVGLLRRHFDLPRAAALTLIDAFATHLDADAGRIAALAALHPGERCEIDLLGLAEQMGWPPSELEVRLLEWQDAGFLRYQGGSRDALLELLPPPPDVGDQIDQLLADYQQRQDQRVEAIAAYARSAQCRHRTLAAHFGQRLAKCNTACDICAPGARATLALSPQSRRPAAPASLPPRNDSDGRSDVQRVLDGLHHLPFPMGRSGLAKVLKGAATSPVEQDRCPEYAALRHLTLSGIEDLIERLIDEGYIVRDERHEHRRLSLSSMGRQARRDRAQLPEWVN